jgi:3-oxoacyl-[acyl-carrier-protein] synthase I
MLALPITAYATCNALGMTSAETLNNLRAGRSAIRPYEEFQGAPCGMAPQPLPALPTELEQYDNRNCRLAAIAIEELGSALRRALQRWGRDRMAIVLGSSTAGMDVMEQNYAADQQAGVVTRDYLLQARHFYTSLISLIRCLSGIQGPAYVISTSCSSGAKSFGSARRLITAGAVDAVLVGGVDALCQTTVRGFRSLGILSQKPCRPFGMDRDGISIGEGAALFLVEREGDGPVRLLGVGESSDAYHMSAPDPEGRGAISAMRSALQQAGLAPSDINHINAHGTGTPINDQVESLAITSLFSDRVPVAATKGYTGHALGAAGAIEAVFSIMAIEHGYLPQSIGSNPIDPAITIRVTHQAESTPCRFVLSNSFAFGGSNASVVFGSPNA